MNTHKEPQRLAPGDSVPERTGLTPADPRHLASLVVQIAVLVLEAEGRLAPGQRWIDLHHD